jgi:CDP-diglyceride synthetase
MSCEICFQVGGCSAYLTLWNEVLSYIFVCCRYIDSVAYNTYRDTGKMQFSEFATRVSPLKSLWLAFLGIVASTGIGPGVHIPPLASVVLAKA